MLSRCMSSEGSTLDPAENVTSRNIVSNHGHMDMEKEKPSLKYIHTKVFAITMMVISMIIITILNLKKDKWLNLVDIVHAIANYTRKARLPECILR